LYFYHPLFSILQTVFYFTILKSNWQVTGMEQSNASSVVPRQNSNPMM